MVTTKKLTMNEAEAVGKFKSLSEKCSTDVSDYYLNMIEENEENFEKEVLIAIFINSAFSFLAGALLSLKISETETHELINKYFSAYGGSVDKLRKEIQNPH